MSAIEAARLALRALEANADNDHQRLWCKRALATLDAEPVQQLNATISNPNLCVHGVHVRERCEKCQPAPTPRFEDRGGTIYDRKTGLQWEKATGKPLTFEDVFPEVKP